MTSLEMTINTFFKKDDFFFFEETMEKGKIFIDFK